MLNVVYMGTPDFAVPALKKINEHYKVVGVYSQPDRPVGRGLEVRPTAVKKVALELGLKVFQPEKLTPPEVFAELRSLKPDVIVVAAYGKLLRQNVLELPRLGCLNIHSSLLPRWRGAAPIQRAILAGDQQTGVSTMQLVKEMDAGDVYLQKSTEISGSDTAGTVHDRLAQMGAELIVETLEGIEKGTLKAQPQDRDQITFADKLTKDMEWLDLSMSGAELDRHVRALNPWPGTSVQVEDAGRLKIKKAVYRDISGPEKKIFEKAGMVLLGTPQGALELIEVQWDGKKAVDAAGFLNGLRGRKQQLPLQLVETEHEKSRH